ncbi:hypothetical protein CKO27_21015 [Thiocystis violacea]|nr:hypothetical protein [Thiocystis violacea]
MGDPDQVAICRLWCEPSAAGESQRDVPSDADKRLAPVAAPLLSAQLFESGCVAAMAVRKLGLRPAPLAWWQRLRPYAWLESRRLFAADAIPTLGSSAELGLALALLLPSARFKGVAIASGSLSGEAPELRDRDVAVHPVGRLEEKLRKILDRSEALLAAGRGPSPALCFTPITDDQGRSVAELEIVARLRRQGIEVVPIRWLSEAIMRLGCERLPLMGADRLVLAAGLTFGIGIALAASAWLWRAYPIPLAFERGGGQAIASEPYLACVTTDGRHTIPQPIARQNRIPWLKGGQKLAWSVRVGTPDAWDARVLSTFGSRGYYLLFAVVSAEGRRILVDHAPADDHRKTSPIYRTIPGELWEQWFQIPPAFEEGECALVILARRDRSFDPNALGRALAAQAGPRQGADWLNSAVNFLQSQAPGFLIYQFGKSNDVPDRCQF